MYILQDTTANMMLTLIATTGMIGRTSEKYYVRKEDDVKNCLVSKYINFFWLYILDAPLNLI